MKRITNFGTGHFLGHLAAICRSGPNMWTGVVLRKAADTPVMVSIPKMSLPELLRNSPWTPDFGRVVQEYNLAAPVLNSCPETGRGCAGLGLAQDLSPACGGRQTIVVLKPTSPASYKEHWDPWGAIFISCLWTTGAPLLCSARYVTPALWLAATWRFLPSLKLGKLVPALGMCLKHPAGPRHLETAGQHSCHQGCSDSVWEPLLRGRVGGHKPGTASRATVLMRVVYLINTERDESLIKNTHHPLAVLLSFTNFTSVVWTCSLDCRASEKVLC